MPVDHDVAPEQVESYIASAAKARGIDPGNSFPCQIRGNLGPYVMHVNAEAIDGPHGMGLPMAPPSSTAAGTKFKVWSPVCTFRRI